MAETVTALRYHGQHSRYVDIATRGTDEHLGMSLDYAVHPSGVGCFILRFVVHGKGVQPKNFKHLMYREPAQFVIPGTIPEMFEGVRLNKLAIPVFNPAVHRHEVDQFALKFGVWSLLEAWVTKQVLVEGFTVLVDLQKEIRNLLAWEPTPEDSVKCVMEFPNLDAPEYKASALKLVKKPEPDLDDEDEDGKGWTN